MVAMKPNDKAAIRYLAGIRQRRWIWHQKKLASLTGDESTFRPRRIYVDDCDEEATQRCLQEMVQEDTIDIRYDGYRNTRHQRLGQFSRRYARSK